MRLSARLLFTVVVSALVASTAVPAALADSIQYILNTTATIDVTNFSTNSAGQYVNVAGLPFLFTDPEVVGPATVPLANASVSVPAGSVITSAFATVTLLQGTYQGTGYIVPLGQFQGHDPSLPSVAPTFSTIGTSEVTVDAVYVSLPAMVNGDEVSPNFNNLFVDYSGHVHSDLESPGSNWAGYLGAVGEVEVPYTIELDVTYSPVPEPSTFVLLGTGILGVAGIARLRFS
jgi:PEP-CTERM motif